MRKPKPIPFSHRRGIYECDPCAETDGDGHARVNMFCLTVKDALRLIAFLEDWIDWKMEKEKSK